MIVRKPQFYSLLIIITILFSLISCSSTEELNGVETAPSSATTTNPPTITSTKIPESTPIIYQTKPPTLTHTPTETPIPTLEGFSIPIPDPRITNPELFDLEDPDAPIPQFVSAMKMAGIEINQDTVIKKMIFQELKDLNSTPYVVGKYNLDPDPNREGEILEGIYPLVIWDSQLGWRQVSLKELGAFNQLMIGSSIEAFPLNDEVFDIYQDEFNLALIGYDLEWFNIEPERGVHTFRRYKENWADPLAAINFALKNELQVMSTSLIYPNGYPNWLKEGDYSKDELIEIVKEHIVTAINELNEKVNFWIVMNEFQPARWGRTDVLRDVIGPELVDIAFQTARETDPSAVLIYNETGNHTPSSPGTKITKEVIQRLKPKELIDGVGLHMHLDGSKPPSKEEVIQAIEDYEIPVYITEFDVNMKDVPGPKEDRFAIQSKVYKEMMEACLETENCVAFIMFTPGDQYSWIERDETYQHHSLNADATAFDDNLYPKPAYYAMLETLYSFIQE